MSNRHRRPRKYVSLRPLGWPSAPAIGAGVPQISVESRCPSLSIVIAARRGASRNASRASNVSRRVAGRADRAALHRAILDLRSRRSAGGRWNGVAPCATAPRCTRRAGTATPRQRRGTTPLTGTAAARAEQPRCTGGRRSRRRRPCRVRRGGGALSARAAAPRPSHLAPLSTDGIPVGDWHRRRRIPRCASLVLFRIGR